MNKEIEKILVPRLRFPEFEDLGAWSENSLDTAIKSESSSIALNKLRLRKIGYPVFGADGIVGFTDFFIQKENYIAIIKDGSGVGKLFLYPEKSSVLGTLAYLKSKDDKQYNLIFFYFLLQNINLSVYIKGSGIPHIYFTDFGKAKIAVPKPVEQQKIADCLSSLDDLIVAESEKLDVLKEHKKGLMQQLFPTEGEKVPTLRFPEFKDCGEWETDVLENVATFLKGKGISKADIKPKGLLPCIRYGELYTHYSEIIEDVISFTDVPEEELVLSEADDVILPSSGETQIDIATASCVISGGIALGGDLNIIRSDINGIFMAYYLSHNKKHAIAKMAQGNAVVHLYTSQLKKLKINFPSSKDEQQKIADCLSSLDKQFGVQTQKIEDLKLHKKGLMQGLFPNIN